MKHVKLLLSGLLLLVAFSMSAQNKNITELEEKNDILYISGTPYTGGCYGKHENGQIGLKGKVVEGKKEGKWTWWYSSGKVKRESEFIKNKKEGLTTFWYENGQKSKEIIYRNDKNIDQKLWNEDGTRKPNPAFNSTN